VCIEHLIQCVQSLWYSVYWAFSSVYTESFEQWVLRTRKCVFWAFGTVWPENLYIVY